MIQIAILLIVDKVGNGRCNAAQMGSKQAVKDHPNAVFGCTENAVLVLLM
jgi:hypothetical protein